MPATSDRPEDETARGASTEDAVTLVDSRAPNADASSQHRTVGEPSSRSTIPRSRERPSSMPLSARTAVGAGSEPSTSGGSSRSTSVVTPRETLHLQEISRTRTFVKIAFSLSILVALTLPLVRGDPMAKTLFFALSVCVAISTAWLGWTIREDAGYSVPRAMVCAYICIATAFGGIFFFGVFSPAPVIIPFGLCFFSTGEEERATRSVFATCSLAHLVLSLLLLTGVVADRGLVRGATLGVIEQLVILVMVEATYAATYVISRASRNATIYAIEEHDRVLRGMMQREALLKEARQDLAQAMRAGGEGRYSDQVIDHFRLGTIIGRGAMGEVYEATHTTTGELAAVKLLLDHVLAQPDHVQRFFREARIISSLNVQNVVRVLAVADIDARIPYIAMERLHGQDLADYLRKHKRLSLAKVLNLIRQVGLGLEAARAAGIVHRDLKPRNLFLAEKKADAEKKAVADKKAEAHSTADAPATEADEPGKPGGVWKILDFGVSKLLADDATLTRDKMVGTPTYMAPEQINAGPITHRTDLFALGIIAYRALTGRPAFVGDSEAEILHKVLNAMPPPPSEVATLPVEVDAVLAIAIAKAPAERFEGASEFAQALEAASRGHLEPAIAARAAEVLRKHPWGNR